MKVPVDLGPVQLLVFGFDQPKFGGGIAAELNRLKERDIVRVIDALVVHKNAEGEIRSIQVTDLTQEQAQQFGAILGGLVGLGAGGMQGMATGAQGGADVVAERGGHVFDPDEWDVLDDIPNNSAAALVLLEHRWAIPLRESIRGEGGVAIGDLWLHPRDLVAAGLIAAEALDESKAEESKTTS
jgi:uncharacterized membrane protein